MQSSLAFAPGGAIICVSRTLSLRVDTGLGHCMCLALSPSLTLILSLSLSLSLPSQDCGSATGVTSAQGSLSLCVSECAPVSGFPRGGLPLSQSPVAAPSPCSQSHEPLAIRTGPSQPRAPGLPPPLPPPCFLARAWLVPLPTSDLYSAVSSVRPPCLSLTPSRVPFPQPPQTTRASSLWSRVPASRRGPSDTGR